MTEGLEDKVLAELLQLRKEPHGATVESLTHAIAICDLLGAGDPLLAYSRMSHEILDSQLDLPVKAAAASLGFLVDGDTHLKRLDAFGAEIGMEQRQVRRYSDRGIRALAKLIATNWVLETAPQLTTIAVLRDASWKIQVHTKRLHVVEMETPVISVLSGDQSSRPQVTWRKKDHEQYIQTEIIDPIEIESANQETSVTISWRGELWPKFVTLWAGALEPVVSESFANKTRLRLGKIE